MDSHDRTALERVASEGYAPRLATAFNLVVLCAVLLIQLLNVESLVLSTTELTFSYLAVIALFCLQLLHSGRSWRSHFPGQQWITLAVQAGLTYIPLLYLGQAWGGAAGFFLGSILLLARPMWLALAAFGAIETATAIVAATHGFNADQTAYFVVANLLTGLVIYTVSTLADIVSDLHVARRELANLAVEEERNRFSRDLHDLLGYSLTAITLKGELAYRRIESHPEDAQQDITTMLGIARQALLDVRSVARSYRELSFGAQVRSASAMLESAGIEVECDLDEIYIPGPLETVLATVVREGVTNLMRHSKAERCRITLRGDEEMATVALSNDGVHENWAAMPNRAVIGDGLGGLDNLRSRVAGVDGTLEAHVDDGWFVVTASVPVQVNRAGRRAAAAFENGTASSTPESAEHQDLEHA